MGYAKTYQMKYAKHIDTPNRPGETLMRGNGVQILTKCYLALDRYIEESTLEKLDVVGLLDVIISNKRFITKFSAQLHIEPNVC